MPPTSDSWKYGDTIALIALVVSILTLILGFIAYRKLLVHEASKAQMSLILKVINDFNRSPIRISGRDYEKHTTKKLMEMTIFGYSGKVKYPSNQNHELIFPSGWFYDFYTMLINLSDNPLTPKKIHEILIQFRRDVVIEIAEEGKELTSVFLIGIPPEFQVTTPPKKFMKYQGGINGFFFCDNFTNAVTTWLRIRGLKDTSSFVTYSAS
jgi:hypothetical protein